MSSNTSPQTWNSHAGFIWSLVGSAVGFANILSFSGLCYRHGGSAFLIPLLVSAALLGVPLLMLESHLGIDLHQILFQQGLKLVEITCRRN